MKNLVPSNTRILIFLYSVKKYFGNLIATNNFKFINLFVENLLLLCLCNCKENNSSISDLKEVFFLTTYSLQHVSNLMAHECSA